MNYVGVLLGLMPIVVSCISLGAPRTVKDVGVLLGLMCKYSCEESKMVVYGSSSNLEVELEKGELFF